MYNKVNDSKYRRVLPKGQSTLKNLKNKRVHLWVGNTHHLDEHGFSSNFMISLPQSQSPQLWVINEMKSLRRPATDAIKALREDIDAFGVEQFDKVVQRVWGLNLKSGRLATEVAEKVLTPKDLCAFYYYANRILLWATDSDFVWLIQDDNDRMFYLPKPERVV